jgi:hypothetical protein
VVVLLNGVVLCKIGDADAGVGCDMQGVDGALGLVPSICKLRDGDAVHGTDNGTDLAPPLDFVAFSDMI